MTGSMYAAIAGLKTHMQNLNVIGNNIANINTQGYKASRSVFKSSIYTTMTGGSNGTTVTGGRNPSQIGYGANIANIGIDMSTGNYSVTGNPTDIMIDGNGFLMVGDKDIILNFDGSAEDKNVLKSLDLTRVGDLDFKADGYLCNGDGRPVYGFVCVGYYEEGDTIPPGLSVGDPKFSDQLVPIRLPRVYTDSDGAVYLGWPSEGGVIAENDAKAEENAQPGGDEETTSRHLLDYGSYILGDDIIESTYELASVTGISIDRTTGMITATCGDLNNQIITIGCIALGTVTNPNGVTNLGNNYYKAGEGSGELRVSLCGGAASSLGISHINQDLIPDEENDGGETQPDDALRIRDTDTELISSGLEQSKTDLAQEIANMIVTQRGYQANTRIVTVTDSMLEELVNMKR